MIIQYKAKVFALFHNLTAEVALTLATTVAVAGSHAGGQQKLLGSCRCVLQVAINGLNVSLTQWLPKPNICK
jgi:hypothetical protein